MLGLALRRAAPGAPGISDAHRTAYASLHSKLAVILMDIERAVTEHKLSPGTAVELCSALIKTHTLRAFCPLLAAASSALLPPPGQPQPRAPRRLVQSSFVLLQEASNALGLIVDVLKRYSQPDVCQPLLSTLATELAESGLLEHWSRLALALGGREGVEERAARLTVQMGLNLMVLIQKKWDHGTLAGAGRAWDSWSELLLSGSSPSLVYLLSSHLVALAAELDGGPTYGLPAAPEEEGAAAGPSSSAPAPAPKGRPPLPLLDVKESRLGPGQPVDMRLAGFALYLLVRLKVIRRRVASMLGGPSTDVIAAARGRRLRAFEGRIRHPDGLRSVFSRGLLPEATWTDLLTHSQAADVASLAGTVAKLLRRRPSPEEGLGDVTALARRFGLMAERGVPGEGLQRRNVAVQAATGGASGAVPAVGSATASGDGSGAGSDLPLSAACIALQLLPEAARVGRALAEAVLPRLSAPAPPPDLRPLEDLVALLLDWMPPLVLAARPLGGPEGLCMMLKDSKIDESAEASMQQISEILRQTTGCPWELERPETGPGARTLLGPSIRLLREALGPGGACEEPQLLTQLEALSACSSLSEAADLGRGLGASPGPAQLYAGATAVLASPAEARRALPGCSNPACTNLAGPSEAALSVQRCGGGCGGAARYCCEGCREAHWAAGHAEECGAAGGSSQAGVQGG
ncbi:hypothetical protein HYH03_006789 [Edaphochlamys debaryana]|uniref:phytol kinase n=1 Tax=Edaphochlamys debaryana TaxID=47281 RepID=A0A835Y3E3_9CHLO|nr:hypothetical protein HYH03_006789 [Edaphochlamys debaryana]|eukprot:KAG2495183.1 hypothetical protein HYH03_006789 [Edaphochlamys debaryana]